MFSPAPAVPRIRNRTRTRPGSAMSAPSVEAPNPGEAQNDVERGSVEQAQPNKDAPYAVGYKRPPRHTRFQKGQSGNPKGRPKGSKGVSTIVNALMGARRPVRIDGQDRTMSGAEIMLHQQAKKAMTGDHRATQFIVGLLQESEAKEALTEAAQASASAPLNQGIDETEVAILAHHYRGELAERGLDEHSIELALTAFGLLPKETDR